MSLRGIALCLGVSPTTVMRDLRAKNPDPADGTVRVRWAMGLDGKVRPNRRFDTTDRDNDIHGLRASGKSIRAIAAEVGCSVGTVHRVLRSTVANETVEQEDG